MADRCRPVKQEDGALKEKAKMQHLKDVCTVVALGEQ